jgi:hypothetical protein
MKTLLWTASVTALLFAVIGPVALAALPVWTGAWIVWTRVDPRPWLAQGPWTVPVWTLGFAQDMVVVIALYVLVVGTVWIVMHAWRDLSKPHAAQPRLTLSHQH